MILPEARPTARATTMMTPVHALLSLALLAAPALSSAPAARPAAVEQTSLFNLALRHLVSALDEHTPVARQF